MGGHGEEPHLFEDQPLFDHKGREAREEGLGARCRVLGAGGLGGRRTAAGGERTLTETRKRSEPRRSLVSVSALSPLARPLGAGPPRPPGLRAAPCLRDSVLVSQGRIVVWRFGPRSGPCASSAGEPRQGRKAAALTRYWAVPQAIRVAVRDVNVTVIWLLVSWVSGY